MRAFDPNSVPDYDNIWPLSNLLEELSVAIMCQNPFCAISMGDGETLFYIHPEIVKVGGDYLINCGVNYSMTGLKAASLKLMPKADYVFVYTEKLTPQQWEAHMAGCEWAQHFHTWPLVFQHYGIRCRVVNSSERYRMVTDGSLFKALGDARILLVGARANDVLVKHPDMHTVGSVRCSPTRAGDQVDAIVAGAFHFPKAWDVALVSAGAAANYICLRLKELGKIAIDFGANMDKLAGDVIDRTGM